MQSSQGMGESMHEQKEALFPPDQYWLAGKLVFCYRKLSHTVEMYPPHMAT